MMRRLERKKERLTSQKQVPFDVKGIPRVNRPGSLWDVTDLHHGAKNTMVSAEKIQDNHQKSVIGPKNRTMYSIKDNRIVRLEPLERQNEYKAVPIVVPVNPAEEQLLEGTKMSLDDIKKMDRFKDYEPGIPSKVNKTYYINEN
jgi:hypothetical protein